VLPRAVVFDNDELLLDAEPCWTRAQAAMFAAHGRRFDLGAKQALVGTSPETAAPVLEWLLDAPGRGQELSAEMYELTLAEISAGAIPRPGAVELVAKAWGAASVGAIRARPSLVRGSDRTRSCCTSRDGDPALDDRCSETERVGKSDSGNWEANARR